MIILPDRKAKCKILLECSTTHLLLITIFSHMLVARTLAVRGPSDN